MGEHTWASVLAVTDACDNQPKSKKYLFWLTVVEALVQGLLALSLWACGGMVGHGGVHRKRAGGIEGRGRREARGSNPLQRQVPNSRASFH